VRPFPHHVSLSEGRFGRNRHHFGKGLINLSATDTLTKISLDKLFDWSGTDAAPENALEEILSNLNR
jgi:hypothetical protein